MEKLILAYLFQPAPALAIPRYREQYQHNLFFDKNRRQCSYHLCIIVTRLFYFIFLFLQWRIFIDLKERKTGDNVFTIYGDNFTVSLKSTSGLGELSHF